MNSPKAPNPAVVVGISGGLCTIEVCYFHIQRLAIEGAKSIRHRRIEQPIKDKSTGSDL